MNSVQRRLQVLGRAARGLLRVVGPRFALVALAFVAPGSETEAQLTLDDVFTDLEDDDPNLSIDYWERSWSSSSWGLANTNDVQTNYSTLTASSSGLWYFWQGRVEDAVEFRSFLEGATLGSSDDSMGDAGGTDGWHVKRSDITWQAWFPGPNAVIGTSGYSMEHQLEDTGPTLKPLIVVHAGKFEADIEAVQYYGAEGPDDAEAIHLGRYLASNGIVFVRWVQGDYIGHVNPPSNPDDTFFSNPSVADYQPLWTLFDFDTESELSTETRVHVQHYGSSSGLSVTDARLDYRFALAQAFIVAGTFTKDVVKHYRANLGGATETQVDQWWGRAKLVYSGGSKWGAAAITAAGADSPWTDSSHPTGHRRAIGVRAGALQAWNLGISTVSGGEDTAFTELSAFNRLETDWLEAETAPDARLVHKNKIFSGWLYDTKNRSVSTASPYYADVYLTGQDEARYSGLLILNDSGTHDDLWALGASEYFWRQHDGMDNSFELDAGEPAWDVRFTREINRGHGSEPDLDVYSVNALARDGSITYVGGLFGINGGVAQNQVAQFDPSGSGTWTRLGSAFNDEVLALAIWGGVLYVGGAFTDDGGDSEVDANFIAKFNSSTQEWEAVSSTEPNGTIRAILAKDNDYLYVGGDFTDVGLSGTLDKYVVKRTSSGWGIMSPSTNGPVHALASGASADVYVGGEFTIGGGPVNITFDRVAKWNETSDTWSALGSGSNKGVTGGFVYALAFAGSDLYVGGDFTDAGGTSVPAPSIAKYDGSSWSALASGTDGTVLALTYHSGTSTLYAGGHFNAALNSSGVRKDGTCRIAKWASSAWDGVKVGANDDVRALISLTSAVGVGGRFTMTGTTVDGTAVAESIRFAASVNTSNGEWMPIQDESDVPRQLDAPVMQSWQLLRRAAEYLIKRENGATPHYLPRIERAAFSIDDASASLRLVVRLDPELIDEEEPKYWRVFAAASDDRDFRRMDGPATSVGPVCRTPGNLPRCFPAEASDGRYYALQFGDEDLGENAVQESVLDGERASGYFDTKSWEDRFFEMKPFEVSPAGTEGDGFWELSFDAPEEWPFVLDADDIGTDDMPILACIVELRVGRPDDDMQDDIAYTEVAFLNDGVDAYPHYDAEFLTEEETPPAGALSNTSASIALVWPSTARRGDFIYIVGSGFSTLRFSGSEYSSSGIDKVTFTVGMESEDVEPDLDLSGTNLLLCGTRIIRCKVPEELTNPSSETAGTITVLFNGASSGPSISFTLAPSP